MIDYIAGRLGVPSALLTSQDERKMIIQQMAEAAQQAGAMQQMQAQAQSQPQQPQQPPMVGNMAALQGAMK